MDGVAACWTNAEKALWCGKPDEKIGVAVFHAPHSARSAEITLAWKRAHLRSYDIVVPHRVLRAEEPVAKD
jgi:uncharacterized protein (UPF0548 family)